MGTSTVVTVIPLEDAAFFAEGLGTPLERECCGLILDPLCHSEASARLFARCAQDGPAPLFAGTSLAESLPVSPWLVPVRDRRNAFLQWLRQASPPGWGLLFVSSHAWDEVCAHLRWLVLAREVRDGKARELVFRFWDNRIFMRIAKGLPQACAFLMGPLRSVVAQDEEGAWFSIENPASSALAQDSREAGYLFDEAHAALFADKTVDVLAYNVAEALYSVIESEGIALPVRESLRDFARRQVSSALPLGLSDVEDLIGYVLCALQLGEGHAWRRACEAKNGRAGIVRSLWRQSSAEGQIKETV